MSRQKFTKFLFSVPRYFDIQYEINPYMGGSVNKDKARTQWAESVRKIRRKAESVEVVDYETYDTGSVHIKNLPDAVFCANHAVPTLENGYILSNMKNNERKNEIHYFRQWAESNGYDINTISKDLSFEGCGDAKWHPSREVLWIGHGYRTDKESVSEINDLITGEVRSLEMTSEYYYHLDVCFEPLTKNTALVIKDAFSEESIEKVNRSFETVIEVPENDYRTMGANCTAVTRNTVAIDKKNQSTINRLNQHGFKTIPVNTSEFMKSGGSVDCLSVRLPD